VINCFITKTVFVQLLHKASISYQRVPAVKISGKA